MFLFLLFACDQSTPAATAPKATPHPSTEALPAPAEASGMISGVIEESLPAGPYTYVRVRSEAGSDAWAATSGTPPAVGSKVSFSTGLPMKDFHSDMLSRDFPLVYFVQAILPEGQAAAATPAPAAPPMAAAPTAAPAPRKASGVPDTHTIADIIANRKTLAGKQVVVSGEVVKATNNVLGRNWLHIRSGTDDMTVTSTETATVGEHIQVSGTIAVDQDFGSGYSYPVMITTAVLSGI